MSGVLALTGAARAIFPAQIGTVGQDYGKAMCVDHTGSVVVATLFQGPGAVDFDPGPGTTLVTNASGIDLALVKYDAFGRLIWVRTVSGTAATPATTVTPHGVAVDASNNVIVIGYFGILNSATAAQADFDPGPGVVTLTNTGGWRPFLAKYTSAGDLLWARTWGSVLVATNDQRAWDVAVDGANQIYVTGYVQGTNDLDGTGGALNYTAAGAKDVFLVKYSDAGGFQWGFGLGDTNDPVTSLKETSVAVDGAGHVFLGGHFNGVMDFDPGAGVSNLTSAGGANSDLFVARYTTGGVFEAVVALGGPAADTAPPGTLRCDPAGNLVFTGRFRGTNDLDPGPGVFAVTNNPVSGAGAADDIWVESLTGDFVFRWGFALPSDGTLDGAHRVAFDDATNVFVAGWFGGTTDFDPGPGVASRTAVSAGSSGASDCFVAKYSDAGVFRWVATFGGMTGSSADQNIVAGLAVDAWGNPLVTGQIFGTNVTFQPVPSPAYAFEVVGQNDSFVFRYDRFTGELLRDADADGIPDGWEAAHGMDPALVSDAGMDVDGDGFTALAEYVADCDPHDANDRLQISDITREGASLTLTFPTSPSRRYAVESVDNLGAGSWVRVTSSWAGTNGLLSVPLPSMVSGPRRFFRAIVVP